MDSEDECTSDYSDGTASEDDEYEDDLPEECVSDNRNVRQQDITQVSDTLSVPRVWATILLRHYNWDAAQAQDAWFTDEEKVRKDVGLVEEQVDDPIRKTERTTKCRVCLGEFPRDVVCASTACGHVFCNLCWTRYVSKEVGCLRCPDPSCAVGEDMINEFVSDEDGEKNSTNLYRSYTKRCPAPGCEFAVEYIVGSSSYDVVCRCGHSFCWNCAEDAHSPVDCDTVHKWVVKNSAESANITWILANCRACPQCGQPIEKNEGCVRMTCSCRYQFCWVCLGYWLTHPKNAGGNSKCCVYEKAQAEGCYDEVREMKKQARDYSHSYTFYYGRFSENHKLRLKAVERLQKMKVHDLAKLGDRYSLTEKQLESITDAWLQIIECRRVLKWTSAYGYYLPTSEYREETSFRCLHFEAETWVERLHRCAEVEFETCLKEADAPKDFDPFHMKLLKLTELTETCFGKLICAVENGLPDVDSQQGVCGKINRLNFSMEPKSGGVQETQGN